MRQPGWYSDPQHAFDRRYWNGDEWTKRVIHQGVEVADNGRRIAPARPVEDDTHGLEVAGYWTAVLASPIGFIIGVILLAKNRVRPGLICIGIALVVMASLAVTLGSSGGSDNSSGQVFIVPGPAPNH